MSRRWASGSARASSSPCSASSSNSTFCCRSSAFGRTSRSRCASWAAPPREMRERASHRLEALGLAGHLAKRPDQLSRGSGTGRRRPRARQRPATRARRRADRQPGFQELGAGVRHPRRAGAQGAARPWLPLPTTPSMAARMDRRIHLIDGRLASKGAPPGLAPPPERRRPHPVAAAPCTCLGLARC